MHEYTWYSAWFLRPRQRKGLNASMYFMNPSPNTSTSVDTAINASSWTPPALHELELNIWRSAVMIASEIWGASSGVTFLSTLCNIDINMLNTAFTHIHKESVKWYFNSGETVKIWKVYTLECTKFEKVFFLPHHRRWCQKDTYGNKQCNNNTKDNSVPKVSVVTMSSKVTAATKWQKAQWTWAGPLRYSLPTPKTWRTPKWWD